MSERKRRAGAGAGASASASKRPRAAKAAASYAESLRSQLRPDASILTSLRALASASSKPKPASVPSSAATKALAEDDPSSAASSYIVVADQDCSSVTSRINRLVLSAARSILAGRGFSFSVPSRGSSNQVYLPDLDRIVLLRRESARPFASVATARKATVTARVLSLVHAVLRRGIHVTKRDLIYTDIKLFGDQSQSDAVLDDVSCKLGCTRSSLHVVASEKGVVVGEGRPWGRSARGRRSVEVLWCDAMATAVG